MASFPGLSHFFCSSICVDGCRRAARRKTGKAWYWLMSGGCRGGGGGGGATGNKFKTGRRSCVDRLRVSTSRREFEPSQLTSLT